MPNLHKFLVVDTDIFQRYVFFTRKPKKTALEYRKRYLKINF